VAASALSHESTFCSSMSLFERGTSRSAGCDSRLGAVSEIVQPPGFKSRLSLSPILAVNVPFVGQAANSFFPVPLLRVG